MGTKSLTTLELKVMNLLWKIRKGFVRDILDAWDEEPKPAYNTVSTIVRILQEKEFIGHEQSGRSHEYHPTISKEEYQKTFIAKALENVFEGSPSTLISSLVDNKTLSSKELAELKSLINKL